MVFHILPLYFSIYSQPMELSLKNKIQIFPFSAPDSHNLPTSLIGRSKVLLLACQAHISWVLLPASSTPVFSPLLNWLQPCWLPFCYWNVPDRLLHPVCTLTLPPPGQLCSSSKYLCGSLPHLLFVSHLPSAWRPSCIPGRMRSHLNLHSSALEVSLCLYLMQFSSHYVI